MVANYPNEHELVSILRWWFRAVSSVMDSLTLMHYSASIPWLSSPEETPERHPSLSLIKMKRLLLNWCHRGSTSKGDSAKTSLVITSRLISRTPTGATHLRQQRL